MNQQLKKKHISRHFTGKTQPSIILETFTEIHPTNQVNVLQYQSPTIISEAYVLQESNPT